MYPALVVGKLYKIIVFRCMHHNTLATAKYCVSVYAPENNNRRCFCEKLYSGDTL